MLNGHGDDITRYTDIRINFSSNIPGQVDHAALFAHLAERLPAVMHYPEPTPARLEAELAGVLGIRPEQVMVTNGATEAIYLIAQAWAGSVSAIVGPTFAEYADACRIHHHTLGGAQPDVVWLCNPNNPTGLTMDRQELWSTLQANRHRVYVIDASYAAFTTQPVISAAEAVMLPHVLMLHSMTKEFAIPGLRLGYVTGPAELLDRIRACRMPWSVNQVALDAGHYLLEHREEYRIDLPRLMTERERMAWALAGVEGIQVMPSHTHILLCRITGGKASVLKDFLAQGHGILIRDASNFEGLDESYFRIAVQAPEENDELIRVLKLWNKR